MYIALLRFPQPGVAFLIKTMLKCCIFSFPDPAFHFPLYRYRCCIIYRNSHVFTWMSNIFCLIKIFYTTCFVRDNILIRASSNVTVQVLCKCWSYICDKRRFYRNEAEEVGVVTVRVARIWWAESKTWAVCDNTWTGWWAFNLTTWSGHCYQTLWTHWLAPGCWDRATPDWSVRSDFIWPYFDGKILDTKSINNLPSICTYSIIRSQGYTSTTSTEHILLIHYRRGIELFTFRLISGPDTFSFIEYGANLFFSLSTSSQIHNLVAIVDYIDDLVGLEGSTVADLGCGCGMLMIAIAAAYEPSYVLGTFSIFQQYTNRRSFIPL